MLGIGKRIREARENLNWTQKELAQHIGVTASAVANYESETSHPKEPVMYRLLDALNVDANYLFQDCVVVSHTDTALDSNEYSFMEKYRRLPNDDKDRIGALIDRTLSGQPITDTAATQKKPIPANEDELDEAIIDMILQLQLTPYELQRLVDFAKGIAAARTVPPSEQHQVP